MANDKIIKIAPNDNVGVALEKITQGESITIDDITIKALQDIPFGHKIALSSIIKSENIIKYGFPIGHATQNISVGEHIHVHNLKTNLSGILDYQYNPNKALIDSFLGEYKNREFEGYLRKNQSAGIRNELWIIPTVGCVNQTAKILAENASKFIDSSIDGVYAYTHNMGCSQLGDDHRTTQEILKGLVNHPNAGGILVLSLGCENNNLKEFKKILGEVDESRVKFLVTQDVDNEYEAGIDLLKELINTMKNDVRQKLGLDKLVLGFKCGGSDAFSGITANALCGRINDELIRHGGSTILTEVPEMFGAEMLLMERAKDKDTFEKVVELINNYKNYFTKYNQTIYENPSPGNKDGGISSLEEKSLGCTQKGGLAPVVGVLNYGETIKNKGLNLLTGSGNDQVSCTNLVASGAQMILFTTGRGNPFGSPVPTIKISSNTNLYNKKHNWIDFNAGSLLEGISFETLTSDLMDYIIDLASGKIKTKNEAFGYREISIFRDGVIL